MRQRKLLLDLQESLNAGASIVGNKAYNLSLLRYQVGIENIPECLVLETKITSDPQLQMLNVIAEIKQKIVFPIIARSSSNVEDSAVSFAGQFISEICSTDGELIDTIQKVIKSPQNSHVIEYCKRKKVDPNNIKMAVLFQPYLPPEMSGVLFTKNPVNNDENEILIEYKDKTSDAVTAGSMKPQSMIVKKSEMIEQQWPFDNLIQIGQRVEIHFGFAVDIEWIVSGDKLWIVQTRQVTT